MHTKTKVKTKISGIIAVTFVFVSLILGMSVNATATGINVSDIYGDPIKNLTINVCNSTHSYNCTTNDYGYCELGTGNFSINFTYCNNSYAFNISLNDGEVKNLTLNLSSTCQIPNSCNSSDDCASDQYCYKRYCKNLNCTSGTASNHKCVLIGCKISAKIGAKIGAIQGVSAGLQKTGEISNCTTLNESNKTYILTENINTGNSVCMNITGNNIVLDCRWHEISGDGNNTGIKITGNNVVVENCIINAFREGIMLDSNSTTIYCNIFENNSFGLSSEKYNANNRIYKNLIRNNSIGVNKLERATNISIVSNEIINNAIGVQGNINASEMPDISNNVICSNWRLDVNFTNYQNTSNCTLPDLAITEIHIPAFSNGNLTIDVTAENLLNLYNGSATVLVTIDGNSQNFVQNKTINNFTTSVISFNFSLSSGIYFATAQIIPAQETEELNELNNALSNAFIVINENQSIIYGYTKTQNSKFVSNINLTLNNSNTILNLTSDENGFFAIVVDEGNYTISGDCVNNASIKVSKNSAVEINMTVNLMIFNITDSNNISLENAKIGILDKNTGKNVTLFTNEDGTAEFAYSKGHAYEIFIFKDKYASFHTIITQTSLSDVSKVIVYVKTESCNESNITFNFENYTSKTYSDLENKIRQNKIERMISYITNKKKMKVGAFSSAIEGRLGMKFLVGCNGIVNLPKNLTVIVNETNSSIKIVRIMEKIGDKTIPIGDVNINFTYKNPNFANIIAASGQTGEQNLSYVILHLDANETNKVGEKILYLPVKNNKGIICVNDNATNINEINNMIENDCNGNWRIMNESDIVTFGNATNVSYYYKVISNGTGAVELNFVFGDANKNNMLDLEDVFKIIEYNIIDSNIYSIPARADANNDRVIDIFDVVEILENISK